jgi:hypothetical protein
VRRYRGPGTKPEPPGQLPRTRRELRDLLRYRRALGPNPRIPLIVPIANRSRRGYITLLLPARYNALTTEPTQLSGNVTVVGKIVFRDLRRPIEGQPSPAVYVDRETVSEFSAALRLAPASVLRRLSLDRASAPEAVDREARFQAPTAVIIPLAIYQ